MKVKGEDYLYFFYSSEYEAMRNEAEKPLGFHFVSGTVVDSGVKKKFSYMSTNKDFMKSYPDAKLISKGFRRNVKYIEPITEPRRGN